MTKYPKIAISTNTGMSFLHKEDILYCESDGSHTHVYLLNEEKITLSKRLKVVLDLLSDTAFVRIHHRYVINLKHVSKFEKLDLLYVELTGGIRLVISKSKSAAFFQHFIKL